jgi:hypothetical protein
MSFVLPTSSCDERRAAHSRGKSCPDALCARQPQHEDEGTLGISPYSQARCGMICLVFFVRLQPSLMPGSAVVCAGPPGGAGCPNKDHHRVPAGRKLDLKIWRKDQDKDEGGNVVWRHKHCRYFGSRQRQSALFDPSSVASSPMYATLSCTFCP